jgi:hypothetical protein
MNVLMTIVFITDIIIIVVVIVVIIIIIIIVLDTIIIITGLSIDESAQMQSLLS